MRWSVALVAVVVLAGCATKDAEPVPVAGIAATDLVAANQTRTMFPLAFAGGTREAELPIAETFAVSDACLFGFPTSCAGPATRTIDLTPIVAAEVPVEMAIEVAADANIDIGFNMVDAQFIQVSDDGDGDSTRIDALLVRAPAGTIELVITYTFPGFPPSQSVTVAGSAHTVTRDEVVPAFLPVALHLEPGDVVNATGDGLEHFVAFPPSGEPLRALQYPFSLRVPEDGPSGTWVLIGDADEALRLAGPNRTLSARLLEFVLTTPVDVPANQKTSFTMDVPGFPLHAGVALQSKRIADSFFAGVTIVGNHQVSLLSPDRVDVLDGASMTCSPFCDFSFLGGIDGNGYGSGFLDEHLKPGSYEATVTMETSNDVQAYGFALYIGQA
ncbi:MAG TPA: hypothetical protein VM327_08060 [Candidatus Thermoplasmatota archaeon]|nr:hypothetical protein [Candidatus Thermoplasmatota archaeon]